MSTSTNHPGAVACLQRPGNSQQFATHYQLLQPTTMQQVPQAPIVQAAPMQHVNQVAPQQVYAPQYQPLQCHGQAHQYHGGNQVAYSACTACKQLLHRLCMHGAWGIIVIMGMVVTSNIL